MIVQVLAVAVLMVGWLSTREPVHGGRGSGGADRLFCCAVACVPLLQLVPLPPSLFATVGGRELVREAGQLAEALDGWVPVSVSTRATLLGFLAGLPAIAVFWCVSSLGTRQRRALSLWVLIVGAVSVFVGLLQVAQGPSSALRFYSITNPSEAVGFFANRNHFSALLYTLLLLTAAWAVQALRAFARAPAKARLEAGILLPMFSTFALLVILMAAQTFTRSRAGLALMIVALLLASLLAIGRRGDGQQSSTGFRLILGAGTLGIVMAIQFALYRILERFEADPLADARIPFARNTLEAVWGSLPWGTGLGTFVPVYGGVERAADALMDTFANRAHNDFLEVWLETGVAGVSLGAVFAIWLLVRSSGVWRRVEGRADIDVLLPRAASVAIVLLLAHSLVDYPLRTTALLALFAFCCALLVPVAGDVEPADARQARRPRVTPASPGPSMDPVAAPRRAAGVEWPVAPGVGASPPMPNADRPSVGGQSGARWGQGIEWPAAWRSERGSDEPSDGDGRAPGPTRAPGRKP
ncbi:MAG: O-antigen ligase family protein [Hyphomicrobiaceae bacterium]|nr:O-antigen ligase family protein [Hyphomicrobiaceae bacterium]